MEAEIITARPVRPSAHLRLVVTFAKCLRNSKASLVHTSAHLRLVVPFAICLRNNNAFVVFVDAFLVSFMAAAAFMLAHGVEQHRSN